MMKSLLTKSALLISCVALLAGAYTQAIGGVSYEQCLADCQDEYDQCVIEGYSGCFRAFKMCQISCDIIVP